MKNISGMTLIECLVAVIILGLLAKVACNNIVDLQYLKLLKVTEEFASALEKNILLAWQRECDLNLNFITDGYNIICDEKKLQSYIFPSSISFQANSDNRKKIVLYQSGVVSPASFLIKHQHYFKGEKNAICQVVLSLRGRVRSSCQF